MSDRVFAALLAVGVLAAAAIAAGLGFAICGRAIC